MGKLDRSIAPEVKAAIEAYPPSPRKGVKALRALLKEAASGLEGVGQITETLKWGEPSYLTEQCKSGSTIRLGWRQKFPDQVSIFVNCQTSLVDEYRTRFPELNYEGNRAINFELSQPLPEPEIKELFAAALTYHSRKRGQKRAKR